MCLQFFRIVLSINFIIFDSFLTVLVKYLNMSMIVVAIITDKYISFDLCPCGEYRSRTDDLLRARQAL